jgi:hypothetical protein
MDVGIDWWMNVCVSRTPWGSFKGVGGVNEWSGENACVDEWVDEWVDE